MREGVAMAAGIGVAQWGYDRRSLQAWTVFSPWLRWLHIQSYSFNGAYKDITSYVKRSRMSLKFTRYSLDWYAVDTKTWSLNEIERRCNWNWIMIRWVFEPKHAPQGTSSIGCGNLHFSFPADLADAVTLLCFIFIKKKKKHHDKSNPLNQGDGMWRESISLRERAPMAHVKTFCCWLFMLKATGSTIPTTARKVFKHRRTEPATELNIQKAYIQLSNDHTSKINSNSACSPKRTNHSSTLAVHRWPVAACRTGGRWLATWWIRWDPSSSSQIWCWDDLGRMGRAAGESQMECACACCHWKWDCSGTGSVGMRIHIYIL